MSREWMDDPYAAQLRAAKAEGELARIKDELRKFAEDNGFNPEMEPRDLLAKAAGSFRSCAAMSDARYEEIRELKAEMEAMLPRLMPEGCEWPRYESGEPVRIGDVVSDVEVRSVVFRDGGILLSDCTSVPGWGTWRSYKEPIKRPAVPAADGEPLEVGQTVWTTRDHDEFTVVDPSSDEEGFLSVKCTGKDGKTYFAYPGDLTHQRPVLDADGVPIETCQKMWRVRNGEEVRVSQIDRGDHPLITYIGEDGLTHEITPEGLTHTKPEIDTWERIEEDAGCTATKYNERRGTIFTTKQQVARDLVRRCKALAGVSGR